MDLPSPNSGLEKELTCSICTELLYQPLTLIDCLHSFCGSCLRDWFSFQATTAENAPTLPPPGVAVYTCPSCRSKVLDTKRNATLTSMVDMVLAEDPTKGRSKEEKEEIAKRYTPGDQVLRKLNFADRSSDELQSDDEDRRLIEEVRHISLAEVGIEPSRPPRTRRRNETRSADGRSTRSRDDSRERHSRHGRDGSRHSRGSENRSQGDRLRPDARLAEDRHHRHGTPRRRSEESSRTDRHQIGHQSSLRSLINTRNMSEQEIAREISELARQIQEEGLLDGVDLENLDLANNDELSRKITEAYRRRQRERSRHEGARRSNVSSHNRPSDLQGPEARSEQPRSSSRQRPHSRSTSAVSQMDDRSRPPISGTSSHLEVHGDERRRSRRRASSSRSATSPVPSPQDPRENTRRSQTDLALRTPSMDASVSRPTLTDGRSTSSPVAVSTAIARSSGTSTPPQQSFASRVPQTSSLAAVANSASTPETPRMHRDHRPMDLAIVASAATNPLNSPTSPGQRRGPTHLYPEPFITCSRCARPHIEYELHYNCKSCSNGSWNICLDCYRQGKGCLYWFGFGYGAWTKWERARAAAGDAGIPRPHVLTANRFVAPRAVPGGADGRVTLSAEDPMRRLQSGNFCARCLAWTNECYWRCDTCNEGDWGYCNACVNQGRSCGHALLPLTYQPSATQHSHDATPPPSPRAPPLPRGASVHTGPNAPSIGPFRPLMFVGRCEVCRDAIAPAEERFHCFSCVTTLEADGHAGDYDICAKCYLGFAVRKRISLENGHQGWRRCLAGHRMVVVAFEEASGVGLRRVLVRDLVGGRNLRVEAVTEPSEQAPGLQRWWWREGDGEGEDEGRAERLVTRDVAATAPAAAGSAKGFPPDGGAGRKGVARWSWFGKAEDELLFPKGAEVREVEDVNGEWFFGSCMGGKGLFPAPYLRMEE